jgi:hypothetical protein
VASGVPQRSATSAGQVTRGYGYVGSIAAISVVEAAAVVAAAVSVAAACVAAADAAAAAAAAAPVGVAAVVDAVALAGACVVVAAAAAAEADAATVAVAAAACGHGGQGAAEDDAAWAGEGGRWLGGPVVKVLAGLVQTVCEVAALQTCGT